MVFLLEVISKKYYFLNFIEIEATNFTDINTIRDIINESQQLSSGFYFLFLIIFLIS